MKIRSPVFNMLVLRWLLDIQVCMPSRKLDIQGCRLMEGFRQEIYMC